MLSSRCGCGFVGQDEFGLVDQGASNGHALLLANGKLPGVVSHAMIETYLLEQFLGSFSVSYTHLTLPTILLV